MSNCILPKGTLVYITSYGPFYGRKGTIRASDCIGEDGPSPIVFYFVTLQDEPDKTFWFENDAIESCAGEGYLVPAKRTEQNRTAHKDT